MKIIDERRFGVYLLTFKEDGILYVHVSDEAPETPEGLQQAIQVIAEMVNYKKVPLLNTRDEFALPSEEVRSFWAQKDSFPYGSAEAYVLPTLALKIIGNAYIIVNKPARPTKFFVNHDEAVVWLKTFLPKN